MNIIIVGCGRVGRSIAEQLNMEGHAVMQQLFKRKSKLVKYLVSKKVSVFLVDRAKVFYVDKLFESVPILLSITFLITAFEMFMCQKISNKSRLTNPINKKTAFIMGCGQAVGVLTGISRSGSTILFGNIARVNRQDNADFTFLMSIPIILSAVLLESVDVLTCGAPLLVDFLPLFFGVLSASVFGYISISFMLSVIKKANYKWFGYYMIFISIINFLTCLI